MELIKRLAVVTLSLLLAFCLGNALMYVSPGMLPAPMRTAWASVSVPDPCGWYGTAPLNVAVNISGGTATTTQIVALTTGKQIWVCEWTLLVGSSATTATAAQFEYGTGANCATGPVA